MAAEIQHAKDARDLLEAPDNIAACLSFLAAMQRLEVVLSVNGVVTRCPIRIGPDGAIIEIAIVVAE